MNPSDAARRQRRRSERPYVLLTVPLVVFLAVFFVWPMAQVVLLSVTEPQPGLQNYGALFTSPPLWRLMATTARISLLTAGLSVTLGFVLAYVMAHSRGRAGAVLLAAVLLPFWLSVVVQAYSWIMLLRSNGLVNGLLMGSGLLDQPLPMMRNEFGVVVGMVHFLMPVGVLMMLGNFVGIDRRFNLAAKSLGASPWQAFRMVYLPLALPGIGAAMVVLTILALGFYITPALLGGGKSVMVAEYISVQILQVAKWGIPAMLSTVMLALVGLTLFALSRVVNLRRVLFGVA